MKYTVETLPVKFVIKCGLYHYNCTYHKDTGKLEMYCKETEVPYLYTLDDEMLEWIEKDIWQIIEIKEEENVNIIENNRPLPEKWAIDVQGFAEEHGMSLEASHKIIQPWLFKQGINWGNPGVRWVHGDFLTNCYIDGEISRTLLQSGDKNSLHHAVQFVTLTFNLTISKVSPDTVEFNGKRYNKEEFEKAIAGLTTL